MFDFSACFVYLSIRSYRTVLVVVVQATHTEVYIYYVIQWTTEQGNWGRVDRGKASEIQDLEKILTRTPTTVIESFFFGQE